MQLMAIHLEIIHLTLVSVKGPIPIICLVLNEMFSNIEVCPM